MRSRPSYSVSRSPYSLLNTTEGFTTRLDFRHYFRQIYKSSTSSGKAWRNLTSKLQSVGSTPSEPHPYSLDSPPERVFKAYVAYDVSYPTARGSFR